MIVNKTAINGLYIIEPRVFEDNRGYFFESYSKQKFDEANIDIDFVQDNQSKSSYGVIRGLHFQIEPNAQSKLVRALEGKILDVAVDMRKGSPTYGKWVSAELSAENRKQMLVPSGFAHGFSVLSETAVVFYKCDNYYQPESERGILYNDPALNIDWQIPEKDVIISEKDQQLPTFEQADHNFTLK